jgi:hypothetical protein
MMTDDVKITALAETENFVAWMSDEPDGEQIVHLELGALTRHFFREEWAEFGQLVDALRNGQADENVLAETENYAVLRSADDPQVVEIELGPMTLYFAQEDWNEVLELTNNARQAIQTGGGKRAK